MHADEAMHFKTAVLSLHKLQKFANNSMPGLQIPRDFGGMMQSAQQARSYIQPMITVLTALNNVDAETAAATLSSLNNTLVQIKKTVAEAKGEKKLAAELRYAASILGDVVCPI